MLIQIGDEIKGKRKLTVIEGTEVLFQRDGLTLKEAHKLAKDGLKGGWDKLK